MNVQVIRVTSILVVVEYYAGLNDVMKSDRENRPYCAISQNH